MNKNISNIDVSNITNKYRFILYAISSLVGIIFAILVFKRVNVAQNPFDSSTEISILKSHYVLGFFLLSWLCYNSFKLMLNTKKEDGIYFQFPLISPTINNIFLSTTLLIIGFYLWLFLINHFPLFICFTTYQLFTLLILFFRFRNMQMLTKTTVCIITSLILSISQFLIFKTPNFIYILMLEEFSSTTAYLITAISLSTILYSKKDIRSKENLFGTMIILTFIFIIFSSLLLTNTYYQSGEGKIFATERWLYKLIVLIVPLVISYYLLYFHNNLQKSSDL